MPGVEESCRIGLVKAPVAFYEARKEGTPDSITQCNQQVAEIFEFGSTDEVVGSDIWDLYRSLEDYYGFRNQMLAKGREHLPLLGYAPNVRSPMGREFTSEVNSRLLRDSSGRRWGTLASFATSQRSTNSEPKQQAYRRTWASTACQYICDGNVSPASSTGAGGIGNGSF
jgi:hypothetical protein